MLSSQNFQEKYQRMDQREEEQEYIDGESEDGREGRCENGATMCSLMAKDQRRGPKGEPEGAKGRRVGEIRSKDNNVEMWVCERLGKARHEISLVRVVSAVH